MPLDTEDSKHREQYSEMEDFGRFSINKSLNVEYGAESEEVAEELYQEENAGA